MGHWLHPVEASVTPSRAWYRSSTLWSFVGLAIGHWLEPLPTQEAP